METIKRKYEFGHVRKTQFIPFAVLMVCAGVTTVVYAVCITEQEVMTYLALYASTLVPLLFPLYTFLFKKTLPLVVCVAVCVHIVCACELGTALHFYDRLGWWDLFAHGFFGFNAALTVFALLAQSKNIRVHSAWLLLGAFCVAMAFGAVWEITEYTVDCLMGSDVQRVAESIAAGKSPVADTMEDLIITVIGVAVFALAYVADLLTRGAIFRKLGLMQEILPCADTKITVTPDTADVGNRSDAFPADKDR